MNKVYKMIRVATVPPIMASALFIILGVYKTLGLVDTLLGILFLGILPILSYPLQRFIPYYKDKGREGQRNLAIIFSVVGYILGCVLALIFDAPLNTVVFIYLDYLISGVLIAIFNKLFHLKASGHACGIVGPIAMLIYWGLYIPAAVGAVLTVFVFISSIKMKRHTFLQLLGGSAITISALLLLSLFF
ncbi:MAG: hypothetical protein E7592_05090 [Ruminococcaceae bacterium]|nr:hypothetical protein [Oscillospiraceae bacterium]